MDYEYNIVSSDTRDAPTWTNGTVVDILSNENYTGTYVFNMQEKSVLTLVVLNLILKKNGVEFMTTMKLSFQEKSLKGFKLSEEIIVS